MFQTNQLAVALDSLRTVERVAHATYAAAPGKYWVAIQANGTTGKIRTVAANTFAHLRTKSVTGTFGTLPALTVPTTFTADVGPIAYVY